jgi:hypothetical protein
MSGNGLDLEFRYFGTVWLYLGCLVLLTHTHPPVFVLGGRLGSTILKYWVLMMSYRVFRSAARNFSGSESDNTGSCEIDFAFPRSGGTLSDLDQAAALGTGFIVMAYPTLKHWFQSLLKSRSRRDSVRPQVVNEGE